MRRLVLIIMMLLLPVQWTWAAAAAYCAHESNVGTQHIGHHVHEHHASGDVSKDGKTPSPPSADNDCGVCHLSGAAWLVLGQDLAFSGTEVPPRLDELADFSSHIPSGPERPDRALAA